MLSETSSGRSDNAIRSGLAKVNGRSCRSGERENYDMAYGSAYGSDFAAERKSASSEATAKRPGRRTIRPVKLSKSGVIRAEVKVASLRPANVFGACSGQKLARGATSSMRIKHSDRRRLSLHHPREAHAARLSVDIEHFTRGGVDVHLHISA